MATTVSEIRWIGTKVWQQPKSVVAVQMPSQQPPMKRSLFRSQRQWIASCLQSSNYVRCRRSADLPDSP
jgi:hypothetical protein